MLIARIVDIYLDLEREIGEFPILTQGQPRQFLTYHKKSRQDSYYCKPSDQGNPNALLPML